MSVQVLQPELLWDVHGSFDDLEINVDLITLEDNDFVLLVAMKRHLTFWERVRLAMACLTGRKQQSFGIVQLSHDDMRRLAKAGCRFSSVEEA